MALQHSKFGRSAQAKEVSDLMMKLEEEFGFRPIVHFLRRLADEIEVQGSTIAVNDCEHSTAPSQDTSRRSPAAQRPRNTTDEPVCLDHITDFSQASNGPTANTSPTLHSGRLTRSMAKRTVEEVGGWPDHGPSELPQTPTKRRKSSTMSKRESDSLSIKAQRAYHTAMKQIENNHGSTEDEVLCIGPADKWVTIYNQAHDEVVKKWANSKHNGSDISEEIRKNTAALATAPVVTYFSQHVFGVTCFTCAYDFAENAKVKGRALHRSTHRSLSLVDKVIDSYKELALVESDIDMASKWRLLRVAEFYKEFNRLEEDAHQPESDFSKRLREEGYTCRKGVGFRSLLLHWFIDNHEIPVRHRTSNRLAYLKNYLHGLLNLGHKLSIIMGIFGKGIFAILPASSDVHIRGWKIEAVEAVCRQVKAVISEVQIICDNLCYDIVEPLIKGQQPTRKYAELLSIHTHIGSGELAILSEELLRPRPSIMEIESDTLDSDGERDQTASQYSGEEGQNNLHREDEDQDKPDKDVYNPASDAKSGARRNSNSELQMHLIEDSLLSDEVPNECYGAARSLSPDLPTSSLERFGSVDDETMLSIDQIATQSPSGENAILPPTLQEGTSPDGTLVDNPLTADE